MDRIPIPDRMTGDLDSVDRLIDALVTERDRLKSGQSDAREKLITQARRLVSTLETPLESILWMIWAEPTRMFASRIALDLDLFRNLVKDDGRPKSIDELATSAKASPLLVNRIARKLSTMNMIDETGPGVYAANSMTHILTIPKYSEGIRFCYDSAGPSFVRMAEYFEKGTKGFENPTDPLDGPFQYAHDTPNAFVWLNEHPKVLSAFHVYVHGQREDRPSWTDDGFYPYKERLVDGLKHDDSKNRGGSALVDVGGGAGHVLEEFRIRVPEWKGRLILQEQQSVIEHATASGDVDDRIELQVHDFFDEQPVKGARAYYMRYILHDWSDDHCRRILTRLKDVMEPGYSRILINDCVVADEGAAWQHVSLDLYMMALTSSYERTESEWRKLIASAGLTVGGIYSKGIGNESLIEVLLE